MRKLVLAVGVIFSLAYGRNFVISTDIDDVKNTIASKDTQVISQRDTRLLESRASNKFINSVYVKYKCFITKPLYCSMGREAKIKIGHIEASLRNEKNEALKATSFDIHTYYNQKDKNYKVCVGAMTGVNYDTVGISKLPTKKVGGKIEIGLKLDYVGDNRQLIYMLGEFSETSNVKKVSPYSYIKVNYRLYCDQ